MFRFIAHAFGALLRTLLAPAISCCCEICASECHGSLASDAGKLQGEQIAFLRNFLVVAFLLALLQLPIFAELAEQPCSLG